MAETTKEKADQQLAQLAAGLQVERAKANRALAGLWQDEALAEAIAGLTAVSATTTEVLAAMNRAAGLPVAMASIDAASSSLAQTLASMSQAVRLPAWAYEPALPLPQVDIAKPEAQIEVIDQHGPEALHHLEQAWHQIDQAVISGALEPAELARRLARHFDKQPGPKVEQGKWTESTVLAMWIEWQGCQHETQESFAARWHISPSYMHKLFRRFGLGRKTGH